MFGHGHINIFVLVSRFTEQHLKPAEEALLASHAGQTCSSGSNLMRWAACTPQNKEKMDTLTNRPLSRNMEATITLEILVRRTFGDNLAQCTTNKLMLEDKLNAVIQLQQTVEKCMTLEAKMLVLTQECERGTSISSSSSSSKRGPGTTAAVIKIGENKNKIEEIEVQDQRAKKNVKETGINTFNLKMSNVNTTGTSIRPNKRRASGPFWKHMPFSQQDSIRARLERQIHFAKVLGKLLVNFSLVRIGSCKHHLTYPCYHD